MEELDMDSREVKEVKTISDTKVHTYMEILHDMGLIDHKSKLEDIQGFLLKYYKISVDLDTIKAYFTYFSEPDIEEDSEDLRIQHWNLGLYGHRRFTC